MMNGPVFTSVKNHTRINHRW